MLSYYDLMKPMLNIGCATKGTGDSKWKAKTPNQTITFSNDGIIYHEYDDNFKVDDDVEDSKKRKEKFEFAISTNFIESVNLKDKLFTIINKLGERYEWELVPAK